jgi:hypothetical protein
MNNLLTSSIANPGKFVSLSESSFPAFALGFLALLALSAIAIIVVATELKRGWPRFAVAVLALMVFALAIPAVISAVSFNSHQTDRLDSYRDAVTSWIKADYDLSLTTDTARDLIKNSDGNDIPIDFFDDVSDSPQMAVNGKVTRVHLVVGIDGHLILTDDHQNVIAPNRHKRID